MPRRLWFCAGLLVRAACLLPKKAKKRCLFNAPFTLSTTIGKSRPEFPRMAKIAFILLCHKDPDAIIRQAECLTATGDFISIHFDARAPPRITPGSGRRWATTPASPSPKRGQMRLGRVVAGAGHAQRAEAAVEAFPRATHFYMLSGDCMAIKSAEYAHDFLDRQRCRLHRELRLLRTSDWIKTGLKREERLIYRHWFNERTQKRLFYQMLLNAAAAGAGRAPSPDICRS
jgi:hypothetical protein